MKKIGTRLGFERSLALIPNAIEGTAAPPPTLSLPQTPNPITPGNLSNLNTSSLIMIFSYLGCCSLEFETDGEI